MNNSTSCPSTTLTARMSSAPPKDSRTKSATDPSRCSPTIATRSEFTVETLWCPRVPWSPGTPRAVTQVREEPNLLLLPQQLRENWRGNEKRRGRGKRRRRGKGRGEDEREREREHRERREKGRESTRRGQLQQHRRLRRSWRLVMGSPRLSSQCLHTWILRRCRCGHTISRAWRHWGRNGQGWRYLKEWSGGYVPTLMPWWWWMDCIVRCWHPAVPYLQSWPTCMLITLASSLLGTFTLQWQTSCFESSFRTTLQPLQDSWLPLGRILTGDNRQTLTCILLRNMERTSSQTHLCWTILDLKASTVRTWVLTWHHLREGNQAVKGGHIFQVTLLQSFLLQPWTVSARILITLIPAKRTIQPHHHHRHRRRHHQLSHTSPRPTPTKMASGDLQYSKTVPRKSPTLEDITTAAAATVALAPQNPAPLRNHLPTPPL